MPRGLLSLVTELVESIAWQLNREDLCHLRLTCREINRKTLDVFGKRCMSTIRTDVSKSSLERMTDFARQNEVFVTYVETLHLEEKEGTGLGKGFNWHRLPAGPLGYPQEGVQTLQNILCRSFTNCKSFHIHSKAGVEEYYPSDAVTPTDAIEMVLAIIANTGLLVQSFIIDFRANGTGRLNEKRLDIQRHLTPEFTSAWSQLSELAIEQSLTAENTQASLELLLRATNLQKLSLNLECYESTAFLGRVISAKMPWRLRELKLSAMVITIEKMLGLISNSQDSLAVLSLRSISLEGDEKWAALLNRLASILTVLRSISVFMLIQRPPFGHEQIAFSALPDPGRSPTQLDHEFEVTKKKLRGEKRTWGVSYCGQDASKALGVLAKSIELF